MITEQAATPLVDTYVAKALGITFRNEHLSVSRLKLWEQCPYAFFCKYIQKGPVAPRDGDDPAMFGVVLHAALEALYEWVVREEYAGDFPLDRLLKFYQQAWTASKLVGVALYQEGVDMLRLYAQTNDEVDHMRILGVEEEFNITIDGYTINGYIDRIDKIADDHVVIVDYKSNRMLFSGRELEDDLQMSIYGIVARRMFPWAKKVTSVFHMLRHDTKQGTTRTAEQLDDVARYVVALGRRTETAKEYPATLNPNCSYCDHRGRCDLYKDALEGKFPIWKVQDSQDLTEVSREREQVAALAKLMYARREELDEILRAKLKHEGPFVAGDVEYYPQNQTKTSYPSLDVVVNAFATVGVSAEEVRTKAYAVSPTAVEELRKEISKKLPKPKAQMLKTTLEALAEKTPDTPRLMSRKTRSAKFAEKGA